MFQSIDAENPKQIKEKPEHDVLLRLREACKEYNIDAAEAAMTEIEKYQYSLDDGFVDWLRLNLDLMSFSDIEERLQNI